MFTVDKSDHGSQQEQVKGKPLATVETGRVETKTVGAREWIGQIGVQKFRSVTGHGGPTKEG